ncbi:hypothetical protein [Clostridium sp. BJN0013]|uniref:hypothetical protein n=1 Tax=Clostridium sp. BJN0013 TaxID=3236840 RepID=UPI0034C69A46
MEELIKKISLLDIYRDTSYYTIHLALPLWRHFSGTVWKGVPYYIKNIVKETQQLIDESKISQETILQSIANDERNPSYFFVAQAILVYAVPIKLNYVERYEIAAKQATLPSEVVIDHEILSCALACFVLDLNRYCEWDFNIVVPEEKFLYKTNDYHLSKVTDVDFRQNGFLYDKKYYLYNIFIDRKSLNAGDPIPAVFRLLKDNVDFNKADFLMRLDERLAVNIDNAIITNYEFSEKFYGPSFLFSETNFENYKNIIVHYDPNTYNKLLMVIKKDFDQELKEEFWHVEVEQLPYITDDNLSKNIITSFIHGKYYPVRKSFRHIDYIKNEYPVEKYLKKHEGRSNNDISIDYYTETKDEHYKIWCVENTDISEELWYKLTFISLSPSYRVLLNEILEKNNQT